MTNPTPRDSAQLPPLSGLAAWLKATAQSGSPDAPTLLIWAGELEALRAQAASVEPYAYEVPGDSKDSRVLAFAPWFHKYGNPLPDGAIPLYLGAPPAHIPADVPESLEAYNYYLDDAPQPQAASPATAVDAVALLQEAHGQIRHLIDDLSVCVDDDGLTRYVPRDAVSLTYSNLIGALIPLAERIRAALAASTCANVDAGMVPLTDEQISEVYALVERDRKGQRNWPFIRAAIAEFCLINGLTVGGIQASGRGE